MGMTSKNIIMMVVTFTGALVVVGNGCSRFLIGETTSSSSSSGGSFHDGTNSGNGVDVDPIAGAPTVTTVYSTQMLESYKLKLGGIDASSRTEKTYMTSRGAISGTGSVTSVTGPMVMAISAIVGDLCDDAIKFEIANGENIFLGFDFNKAGLPSTSAINDAIDGMGYGAWQKDGTEIDPAERKALHDMLLVDNPIGVTEQNGQYKAALMLCTAMYSTTLAIIR